MPYGRYAPRRRAAPRGYAPRRRAAPRYAPARRRAPSSRYGYGRTQRRFYYGGRHF